MRPRTSLVLGQNLCCQALRVSHDPVRGGEEVGQKHKETRSEKAMVYSHFALFEKLHNIGPARFPSNVERSLLEFVLTIS